MSDNLSELLLFQQTLGGDNISKSILFCKFLFPHLKYSEKNNEITVLNELSDFADYKSVEQKIKLILLRLTEEI